MLLSELGAEVIRIDRTTESGLGIERPDRFDLSARGRRSVAVDLKHPDGVACVLDLIDGADALVEGFRPGVMERLGLGPDVCLARNPRLVFGRVTGWGQHGPLARTAGHDLNYIAITGALHGIGREGAPPTPPLNLVGDFAGGSLFLVIGIVSALLSAQRTGEGQVVDAAIVDGVSLLMAGFVGLHAAGLHDRERGRNLLDGGAPTYDVYLCADGEYLSVAPIEPKFREIMLAKLGLAPEDLPDLSDPAQWPEAKRRLAETFATRPRDAWCDLFAGSDACVAPVLSPREAPHHPHNEARGIYVDIGGIPQPAPAPRFSATPPTSLPEPPEARGASTQAVLRDWGIDEGRIETLTRAGVIGVRSAAS